MSDRSAKAKRKADAERKAEAALGRQESRSAANHRIAPSVADSVQRFREILPDVERAIGRATTQNAMLEGVAAEHCDEYSNRHKVKPNGQLQGGSEPTNCGGDRAVIKLKSVMGETEDSACKEQLKKIIKKMDKIKNERDIIAHSFLSAVTLEDAYPSWKHPRTGTTRNAQEMIALAEHVTFESACLGFVVDHVFTRLNGFASGKGHSKSFSLMSYIEHPGRLSPVKHMAEQFDWLQSGSWLGLPGCVLSYDAPWRDVWAQQLGMIKEYRELASWMTTTVDAFDEDDLLGVLTSGDRSVKLYLR